MAKRKKPTPAGGLEPFRGRRFFEGWEGFVDAELVDASEASLRKLVEDLIALGPSPDEAGARRAVDRCVRRFNRLDEEGIRMPGIPLPAVLIQPAAPHRQPTSAKPASAPSVTHDDGS